MKKKAILEETRLIKQANEKLPVKEQNEYKVRGIYNSALQEINNERSYDRDKYMYMSDSDMAEIVNQRFQQKMVDEYPEMEEPASKPDDVEAAEEDFAGEMDDTDMENEVMSDIGLDDEFGGDEFGGEGDDFGDETLPMEEESLIDEPLEDEEGGKFPEGDEGLEGEEMGLEGAETPSDEEPVDEMNVKD